MLRNGKLEKYSKGKFGTSKVFRKFGYKAILMNSLPPILDFFLISGPLCIGTALKQVLIKKSPGKVPDCAGSIWS